MGRTGQCKVKLVKRFKVWKLKQAETEDIFRERQARAVLVRKKSGSVWYGFEEVSSRGNCCCLSGNKEYCKKKRNVVVE